MKILRLLTYITCLCLCCQGAPVVSEIHGNPEHLPDSEGEYLELFHADSLPYSSDSLTLTVNSDDTLRLPSQWEAYQIVLICRDSSAMATRGFSCYREWPSLSLANSQEVSLIVTGSSRTLEFSAPPPLPGVSWENVLGGPPWNQFVEASHLQTVYTDKGSPGEITSQSAFIYSKDVALKHISTVWDSTSPPSFTLEVEQKGRNVLTRASLKVSVDRDWDGSPDITLDSLPVNLPHTSGTLSYSPTTAFEGFYHFLMEGDPNPSNNSGKFSLFANAPLKLSEVCPDPPEGTSEWIEVHNTSARPLSLRHITLNGNALETHGEEESSDINGYISDEAFLAPYSYAVLAENSESFLAAYPSYSGKVWEVTKWPGLKNTGDTVLMAWSERFPLDSMMYGNLSGVADESCWERSEPNGQWVPVTPGGIRLGRTGTPGDSTGQASRLHWEVTPKIINTDKAGSVTHVNIEAPLNLRYALHTYSLNGEEVAQLCDPCQGSRELTWNGRSGNGTPLPMGPYILTLKPEGLPVRKKTVILAKPL